MKSAFGNILGTFISAMTGMNVEVEPNPAMSSRQIQVLSIEGVGTEEGFHTEEIQRRNEPGDKPGVSHGNDAQIKGPFFRCGSRPFDGCDANSAPNDRLG